MAELKHTVAVGRVRYPAGTPATQELRELIDAKHWTDGEDFPADRTVAVTFDPKIAEELEQLRELAANEVATRDARITELEDEVERLTAELGAAGKATPEAQPIEVVDYTAAGWTGQKLKAEIDKRNDGRDPAGEAFIRVEPPGNKPELAAALTADDSRTSGS